MRIRALNPNLSNSPKTLIATAIIATGTSITVKNTNGFANNDYIQVGETGAEKTEIVKATTVTSPDTFTVGALKYAHGVDTPIYGLLYNQVRFYRSTDGGVIFNLLATTDITPDTATTIYSDTSSLASYYYKTCFYNATTGLESLRSQSIVATGYTSYSLKKLEDQVLTLYPDKEERIIKREDIKNWINARYLDIQADLRELDQGYFLKDNESSPASLTSGTSKYALPSDFYALKRVEVAFDGTTYYTAKPYNLRKWESSTIFEKTNPVYDFIGNTIWFRPTADNSSGKYKLFYWYTGELEYLTDEIDQTVRVFKDVLILHGLGMACYAGKQETRGDRFIERADRMQQKLVNRLGRRQSQETQKVEIEDATFLWVEEENF
jgi:hypothetical protein